MSCVVDVAWASSLIDLKIVSDELMHEEVNYGASCTDISLAMYMAFSMTPVFSTQQSLTGYDYGTATNHRSLLNINYKSKHTLQF